MADLAVGLMSGTSADGIDAALVSVTWRGDAQPGLEVISHRRTEFAAELRALVLAVASGERVGATDLALAHAALGDAYAEAARGIVEEAPERPVVIGVHGQTVAHLPARRATLQLGDAARVAVRTAIPVVSDFRSADVAAGGEGAPLTPFADQLLFADGAPRVVLNLGGIANVTLLPDAEADHVTGFDTGPGNMVIDGVARAAGLRFDEDGRGARRGRVVEAALTRALADPYFTRPAPKSAGREELGAVFCDRLVADVRAAGGSLPDALATATELTARTVADVIRAASPAGARWRDVLVGGGGAANATLMEALRHHLAPIPVRPTDEAGVPAAAREATAFALLAFYRLHGRPNTLPRVTGAARAVCAGALHQP